MLLTATSRQRVYQFRHERTRAVFSLFGGCSQPLPAPVDASYPQGGMTAVL